MPKVNQREFDIIQNIVSCPSLTKVYGEFLLKETVRCYGGKRIGNEVVEGAVPGVFNLGNILQLVIDRFN